MIFLITKFKYYIFNIKKFYMLKHLKNKFILVALVTLCSGLGMYLLERGEDKEKSNKYLRYLKHMLLVYVLVIGLIYLMRYLGDNVNNTLVDGNMNLKTVQPSYQNNINVGEPNF